MSLRMKTSLLALAALALLFWGGLLVFVDLVARQPEPAQDVTTEGIVVLTGGTARMAAAFRLLHEGKAERMLISGARPGVTRAALVHAAQQALGEAELARPDRAGIDVPMLMECCVDVGFEAGDTAGNAVEAAGWAAQRNLQTLRLVTANYHMPRALVEFSRRLPATRILPHPVRPDSLRVEDWWRQRSAGTFVVGEFTKYIAALVRARIDATLDVWLRSSEAG